MEGSFNYNGKIFEPGTPVITADNRGFRYGDGIFETIKLSGGKMELKNEHFDRLFAGIAALHLHMPALHTRNYLEEQILATCRKNKLTDSARIRITLFRGDGGVYEPDGPGGGFIIQTWPLPQSTLQLNDNGLIIGLFTSARKSCDSLANLKTNNYLIYILAGLYAKEQHYNDCLIINEHSRVCESTIANIFWISNKVIYTPPLTEGCVAGVMRQRLLQQMKQSGYAVEEKPAEAAFLETAEEIFLTNAISGIRWVRQLGNKNYTHTLTRKLYKQFIGEAHK